MGTGRLLITGALDFVVEPLRPLFDEIVCAHMGERDGKLTGELTDSPPTGEARALLLDEFARAQGLSLADTVAYADSTSDLPMLEAAGFPVVVNPEAKLAAIAAPPGLVHRALGAGRWRPAADPCHRHAPPGRADQARHLVDNFFGTERQAMKALQFERNVPRFAAARVASALVGSGKGVRVGPLELVELEQFELPGHRDGSGFGPASPASVAPTSPHWTAAARDTSSTSSASPSCLVTRSLATSRAARSTGGERSSSRCSVARRGASSPAALAARRAARAPASGSPSVTCVRDCRPATAATPAAAGRPALSLTRASCTRSPTSFSDEAAVMVEPAACAVHAALAAEISGGESLVVLGAGTLGLCVIAALRALCLPGTLVGGRQAPGSTRSCP